ncbi:MAG: hypothetical protein R3F62_18975 [Planctomycetota bacterium]
MRALIVAAGLVVGSFPSAFAQEDMPDQEERAQTQDARSQQLEVLLKKLLSAVRAEKADTANEALRSLIPSKGAVEAALTKEGFAALGGAIQASSKETFGSGPEQALKHLALSPELRKVDVFSATTEDLLSMETETTAAREFASGLRTVAAHLKPGETFYCAHLYPRDAKDDPRAGTRLQVFFFHEDRFVYLGPLWKLAEPK